MPDAVAPSLDLAVHRIDAILDAIWVGPMVGQGAIQCDVVLPISITLQEIRWAFSQYDLCILVG